MKAGEKTLVKYLEGNDQRFVIPVFQRRYGWRKEHCQRLWADLHSMIQTDYRSHFFGSIVSVVTPSPRNTEYLIIDGQQRITTVSLLMAAICNMVGKKELDDPLDLATKIRKEYLIDQYETDDDKVRLKLIEQDCDIYNSIVDGDLDDLVEQSNVLFNYEFFIQKLGMNKDIISIDQLFKAIRQLFIVDIQLKQGEDDPQLIFESLNSTGLALSEADKVRNLVLMNLSHKQQKEYYIKYWKKIETNTTLSKNTISEFIRDYLTIKLRRIPRADQVYIEFKDYQLNGLGSVENTLIDMLKYSKYYYIILSSSFPDLKVSKALVALQKLDNRVTYPYLMELIDNQQTGIITNEDLEKVLRYLENFLFRRTICSVPANALNKLFMALEKEIRKFSEWKDQYVNVFGFVISSKQASGKYPSDDEFLQSLINRDIYNMQSRTKVYLLEELENFGDKHVVDVTALLEDKVLNIEHIMPQTLSAAWEKTLGPNSHDIHVQLVHTIGNLTLTAYNSFYSNYDFLIKRDMDHGLKDSKLALNQYVVQCAKWGELEINERAHQLAIIALQRWPMVKKLFNPSTDTIDTINLSDEVSYRFKNIQSYEFRGIEKTVTSWTDMYKQIFILLFDQDPSIIANMINEPSSTIHIPFIASTEHALRMPFNIGDNLYVELNMDTDNKIKVLKYILEAYNEDMSGLSFTIKADEISVDTSEVDDLEHINLPRVTIEQWRVVLEKGIINSKHYDILTRLYQADGKKLSVKILAEQLGLKIPGLNSQAASFGKGIIHCTNIEPQYKKDGSQRFWNIPFLAELIDSHYTWILRPELILAIDEVGFEYIKKRLNGSKVSSSAEATGKYKAFWQLVLSDIHEKSDIFTRTTPSNDSWFDFSSGISGLVYGMAVTRERCYVYFIMMREKQNENKQIFDFLLSERKQIEHIFGQTMIWRRCDDKKSSIVEFSFVGVNIKNVEDWSKMRVFLVANIIQVHKTFSTYLPEVKKLIKSKGI